MTPQLLPLLHLLCLLKTNKKNNHHWHAMNFGICWDVKNQCIGLCHALCDEISLKIGTQLES